MKNNLSAEQFAAALRGMGACDEALEWAHGMDYNTAWSTCGIPDWMLFLIGKAAPLTSIVNELLVCRFAREVVYLTADPRVLACIEVREAWARGEATDEERGAAIDAARSTTRATAWAATRAATRAAAVDAAGAAAGDAAGAAAGAAAWATARAKQCDIIRELVAQPELGL